MLIYLNGFRIELSASRLPAQEREVPDPGQMKALRETYRGEWFLYWGEGKAFGIPRLPSPGDYLTAHPPLRTVVSAIPPGSA